MATLKEVNSLVVRNYTPMWQSSFPGGVCPFLYQWLAFLLHSCQEVRVFLPCNSPNERWIKSLLTSDHDQLKWLHLSVGVLSTSDEDKICSNLWSNHRLVCADCSHRLQLLSPLHSVGWRQGKVGQLTWRPSLVSLQQGHQCGFGHWRAPVLFHRYDRIILKITVVVG